MNIRPEHRATANGVVDVYSALTPILKKMLAKEYPDVLSLAYQLQDRGNPHFNGIQAAQLDNFLTYLGKVEGILTRTRITAQHVPSKQILEMAMR